MDAAGSTKDAGENKNRLASFLSNTDLSKIPEDVAQKIDKKIEEDSALHEKRMSETKSHGMSLQYEELKARLAVTDKSLVEKGNQVVYLTNRLGQAKLKITSLENELVCLRSDRDVAIDEKNDKIYALETKTAELERLNTMYSEKKTEIQKLINEKSTTIAFTNELQSKVLLTQIEKNELEKERGFLDSQIRCLHDELDKLYKDLQTRTNSHDVVALTTQLNIKTEELKNAEDATAHLKEIINTLKETVETLRANLKDKELDIPIIENYQKELEAQKKAVNLYKYMQKEAEAKLNKMEDASTKLQHLLRETSDKYNDLEIKHKKFEMDHETLLEKKNEVIGSLKTELENATKQNLQNFLSELAPSAAATIKLLKPEMSLTQLYIQVVKATDDLAKEKENNTCLNNTIFSMEQELQKKESLLQRQIAHYKETLETNRYLSEKLDLQVNESNRLKEVNTELSSQANHYKIENNRLKGDLRDLAYQVCFLLNKVESMPEKESSNNENVPEIASKALITFSDIQELQINNQKLLRMIRDLREKQEELEYYKEQFNATDDYKKEIVALKDEITKQTECHTKMLKNLIRQRDKFKKLYNNHIEGKRQECTEIMNSSIKIPAEQGNNTSMETVAHEEKLNVEKELESLKDQYNVYKEERANNENMLIEQIDSMRQEITKLTGINFKSAITIEDNNERLKTYKSNIDTYKSQIKSLEERNKLYDNIISKHEISLQSLRDEVLSAQKYIAAMNVKNEIQKSEIKLLKNIQTRIQNENDFLNRERLRQTDIMANFEKIKISMQREQEENQTKLESKLDEATRECSALRLRLQEEQDSFRELGSHLERQTKTAKTRMLEEKNATNHMRLEISQLRQEIAELENRLINRNDPTIELVKKIEDLENKILQKDIEIRALEELLDVAKQTEKEKTILSEEYKIYKKESEEKMTECSQKIQVLHEYCSKLEVKLSSLRTDGENCKNSLETTNELLTNEELKHALKRNREELASVQSELTKLTVIKEATADKYNREIVLHSTDIQALSKVKEELFQIQAQLKEMIAIRDIAVTTLETEKSSWDKREMILQAENEQLLLRLENLNSQNSLLHDQIHTLSAQPRSFTDSMNDSANSSNVNMSIGNTEEVKSSVQLLQIITLLRQEKDLAVAKYDISKAEAMRFKLQLENTKIRLDKIKLDPSLNKKRSDMAAMNTQADIRRILETNNALTDSSRILRIERDSLLARVEALTNSIKALKEQLLPLQEKVSALTSEKETLQSEYKLVKDYSTKQLIILQNKINALTSANETLQLENKLIKDNSTKCKTKVNSDDWKRLQNERESLVKLLTKEKKNNNILKEELVSMKIDKDRIEEKHTALLESITKLKEELNKAKVDLIASLESNTKLMTDLSNKDAAQIETREKELKIIKIAKKYKTLYEDLIKTVEAEKKETLGQSAVSHSANVETDSKIRQQLNELQIQLKSEKSCSESLKTELESLRKAKGNIQIILKQATDKQFKLTKANNDLILELSKFRSKIETLEQSNRDEQDARLAVITSQFENRVSRLEGEKKQILTEKNRELKSLQEMVTLLQRQLLSQTTTTKQQAVTTCDPSTANINLTAGEAEQSVSGSTEQTTGNSSKNISASSSSAQKQIVTESQDPATMEFESCHSPEIVPNIFRTRTRSASSTMKSATVSTSASVSMAAGGVTTPQATRTSKRTQPPRKSSEPKRIKLQDNKHSTVVEPQAPTSSHKKDKKVKKAKEDKKDKKSKAETAQSASEDSQKRGENSQGQADGEKSQGQADGEKSQGQADGEKSQGQTDGEKSQGQADGEKSQGQAGEKTQGQADGEKSQGQAGEKTQGQADGEKSQGQTDGEKSQGQADGEKSQGQAGEKTQGQADGEKSEGQADGKKSQEQADGKKSQGQADGKKSQGQADGDKSQGQADGKKSQGQTDGEKSQGQADGKKSQGQADSEKSQGQTDGKKSQGQADGEKSQGQADGEKSQGQADAEKTQGQAYGEPPATPPQVEVTNTGNEPTTAQPGGADDGGDSVVPCAPTVPGRDDGAQSGTSGAAGASGDAEDEIDQNVGNDMPPLDIYVPEPPPEAGPEDEAVAAEVVRGDLHPPLIRPQGALPYWNHQREDVVDAEGRLIDGVSQGHLLHMRGSLWQPNRFNIPDNQQRSPRNRRNRGRGRFFRRPFF